MKEGDRKKIEAIIGKMQCPKDFKCAESGFNNLCKAEDQGIENYLECLEASPLTCKFALSFGNGHYCQCPLRVYLAKKLHK